MAADYLVSSLQPLAIDGAAPCSKAAFLALCRDQLGERHARAIEGVMDGAAPTPENDTRCASAWRDLNAQLRNAVAAERARARGADPSKWRRHADGCSLYWAGRVQAAFQEKDPARRDRMLDLVRWDAAGELTPPASPLSAAAAYTYGIRLSIVLRRQALSAEAGNSTFDALTAAAKLEL